MHSIRHQSDAATNARLRAKSRHAEPIPQRAAWRLHAIRVIREARRLREELAGWSTKADHMDEPMWPVRDSDPMRPWATVQAEL